MSGRSCTATSFAKRTYEPIDDVDQLSCRPDFAIPVYSGYLKPQDKDELAPWLSVPSGTPPVFLVHGGDDIVSPPEHSVLMYLALKRAGVPAELHVYDDGIHAFLQIPIFDMTRDALNRIGAFGRRTTGVPETP